MHTFYRRLGRLISALVAVALLAGCSALNPTATTTNTATSTGAVGTVKTITAVTSVSGTGSALALQTVAVAWKTTGTVGTVNVKAGDQVKAGQVLMTIDPDSVSTALLQAQAELSTSVQALNDLLHPSELKIANAQKAVADAQDNLDNLLQPSASTIANAQQAQAKAQSTLETAEKTLKNSQTVDVAYYQDQYTAALNALTNAQQNATVTDIGSLPVQLRTAQADLERATNVYNNAQEGFTNCPNCEKVWAYDRMISWVDAQNLYTDAVNKVNQIQIQIDQAQRSNTTSVASAQEALATAERNLKYAGTGPDVLAVSVNQAAVNVAKAALADADATLKELQTPDATKVAVAKATLGQAQDDLAALQNPDPTDVVTAQARVAQAQAALDVYTLTAPMDGEVLAVSYQPGDILSGAGTAVTLGNRAHLRVEVQVDESDIGKVRVGNPVTLTVDALPDMELGGAVSWINPVGTTSSGLVKYTVRVDTATPEPQVLLGMTTNAMIVTDTQLGALAVPLAAVQYDSQGEYVNRVQPDGSLVAVAVKSGKIQSGLVVVEGDLKEGDQVSLDLVSTATTTTGNGGGGFGMGVLTGGGGDRQPPPGAGGQP